MKSINKQTRLPAILTAMAIIISLGAPAIAVDDGARAYWKGRDGTNVVAFQYLNLSADASKAVQFDPGLYIYPNSQTQASIITANYVLHKTMLNRPSVLSFGVVGGNVEAEMSSLDDPPPFPGGSFSQSSAGFGDPNMQLVMNLMGTPPLKSTVDLLNYEPTWTLDAAVMLAAPLGEYDGDKLVNMGLNRWYSRIALPFKWHFGPFSRGYMTSLELIPSVWLFSDNDDFGGTTLKNDPLLQFEAHLTHDFTPTFFGSLDLLYRGGFESEIDGIVVGDDLELGSVGFTLNYNVTDNVTLRAGYSANVFGDKNVNTSLVRFQIVYAWHRATENIKKLQHGH